MIAEIQKIETAARMAMGNFDIPSQKPANRVSSRTVAPVLLAVVAALVVSLLALS